MANQNLAIRFARTIRDLLVPPPSVPHFDEHPDPLIARLEWAIAGLPEQTREVFMMHPFDDLPYDRIATRLGISEKAVEQELDRSLRANLQERDYYGRSQEIGNTAGRTGGCKSG